MKMKKKIMAGILSVTLSISAMLPAYVMAEEEMAVEMDDEIFDDVSDPDIAFDDVTEDFFEEDTSEEVFLEENDETLAEEFLEETEKETADGKKETEEESEVESEINDLFEAANPYGNTVKGFVYRLYSQVLNRTPDSSGLNYWVNELTSGRKTGAQVAANFIHSSEFTKKNISDSAYLEILYNTFFDRASDASGKSYWQKKMDLGMSRDYVLRGFVNSREFKNICSTFGIKPGEIVLTEARDQNQGVTMFVFRLYQKCFGRKADVKGLNYWCEQLLNGSKNAKMVAYSFYSSYEMDLQYSTIEEYITLLYQGLMNRNPDKEGMNYWMYKIDRGITLEDIFYQFADSKEFRNLVASYGLYANWKATPVAKMYDGGTFTVIIPASWEGKYDFTVRTLPNGDVQYAFFEKKNHAYYLQHKDDGVTYDQGYCNEGLVACIVKHKGTMSSTDMYYLTHLSGCYYYGYRNGYSYSSGYDTGVPYNARIAGMTEPYKALENEKYLLLESFMFK